MKRSGRSRQLLNLGRAALACAASMLLAGLFLLSPVSAQQSPVLHLAPTALSGDPACQTLTPTGAGGPAPKDPVVVLRWLGNANYELAYRDNVILLDAHYDRSALNHPIGVAAKDFKKANAILIGHAHSDQISDAASVAKQTGAMVIGASLSADVVRKQGVPEAQIKTVKGMGEEFKFTGFTVRAILGHHDVLPQDYMDKISAASAAVALIPVNGKEQPPEMTAAQKQEADAIAARGSTDPKIIEEGTIGCLFNFDNGFRLMWVDSAGPLTDEQHRLAEQFPTIDVGLFPLYGMDMAVPLTMEYVRLFHPAIMMPTAHDGAPGSGFDEPTVPVFLKIRDELPRTKTYAPLYRTPLCVNTMTKQSFVSNK